MTTMNTMKYGTAYFPTREAAIRYYRPYEGNDSPAAVDRKLAEGSIHIGTPPTKPGDVLTIEDNRYHVTEPARADQLDPGDRTNAFRND